MLTHIKKMWTL